MKTLLAKVMPMPVISLQYSFAVEVISPVEMPPRVYNVSYQEVLILETGQHKGDRIFYQILAEKVLSDYNRLVQDCPIMDMFADPSKYEPCSHVEWITVYPEGDAPVKLVN